MINRRSFIKTFGMTISAAVMPAIAAPIKQFTPDVIRKAILSSGENLIPIGMGTWQTFNVGSDIKLRDERTRVLDTFFAMGGELVDSSPMYGSSQSVIGYALNKLNNPKSLFSADKIWTSDGDDTFNQAKATANHWGIKKFDLLQVHNLQRWKKHLAHLKDMKQNGQLKYVGVTTSHGRRHSDLAQIMKTHPLDFVQLTYNIEDREVEEQLLPLALEKGIAIIANRPFQGGNLIRKLKRRDDKLPGWAREYQCENWSQFLLKFVISHPSVTCAIPATTKVAHMKENMGAILGPLFDTKVRQKALSYVASL